MKPSVALLLPLLLVACSSTPAPPALYSVSGVLYDFNPVATPESAFTPWSGGAGDIKAMAAAEALATASVSAQGAFKLMLPAKPDDSSLVTLEAARRTFNNPACTGSVTISNPQALVNFVDFAVVRGDDTRAARPYELRQTTGSDGLTHTISTTGALIYANAPTTLAGEQVCGSMLSSSVSKITVNWELKQGYNTVLLIEDSVDTQGRLTVETTYINGPLPAQWIAPSISTVFPLLFQADPFRKLLN
ncbi:hypothetical protein [Deinococcus sp.]|uniref:hypothetical protein n=1 Tax=Deinococcus sp. TaxID=47478 RepID=UPI003B5B8EB7